MGWNTLKSRKLALLAWGVTFLISLAFTLGTRCHVLEQLLPALIFPLPALPFLLTKVPVASTASCIALWPFVLKANDINCVYNGGGYFLGSGPIMFTGMAVSLVVGILVLVKAYPRDSSKSSWR